MKTSEETKNIIEALTNVQSELSPVGKDRVNPFAESSYATLDAILKEVVPKLTAQGVFMTQEPVTTVEENLIKIGVVTRLMHKTGEYIEYEPLFMQLEKGAKMNMAQSAGSVITYAKRYSISAIMGISTDEDNDGVQPKSKGDKAGYNQQQKNTPQQKKPAGVTSTQVNNMKAVVNSIAELTGQDAGAATEILLTNQKLPNKIESLNNDQYGTFLNYLNGLQRTYEKRKKAEAETQTSEQTELSEIRWGQPK